MTGTASLRENRPSKVLSDFVCISAWLPKESFGIKVEIRRSEVDKVTGCMVLIDTLAGAVKTCSHVTKITPLFMGCMAIYEGVHMQQFQALTVKLAEWIVDLFVPKFYSPIQNNIGLNFGDGLDFVRCEKGLRVYLHRVATCQGNVSEKQNFLQVREKPGNFEKASGNFGHLTHVREFCQDIFLRLKLLSYANVM